MAWGFPLSLFFFFLRRGLLFFVAKNVMQSTTDAKTFYTNKVKDLDAELAKLERVVQSKATSLRAVEESRFFFPSLS